MAANVLKHGTGALNIDGCRIEAAPGDYDHPGSDKPSVAMVNTYSPGDRTKRAQERPHDLGRWPANIIHDGSEEVLAGFPESVSSIGSTAGSGVSEIYGEFERKTRGEPIGRGDSGSAARFFYCAKATSVERGEGNNHPTVKPVALMRWLVRLVTPKGGLVLDPFAGSGSTLIAADQEQLRAIGIELSEEYAAIARRRISGDRGPLLDAMGAAA